LIFVEQRVQELCK